MHTAFAIDHNAWIAENTVLCYRMAARISTDACRKNQQVSCGEKGDYRCEGCGGLNRQNAPGEARPRLAIVMTVEHEPEPATQEVAENHDGFQVVSLEELDDSGIDEDELDEELLALFPEYAEEVRIALEKPKKPAKAHRVAVYAGRCKRCSGYMTNDLERHDGIKDDEIYRCFTCGWRTSPAYEWNRNNAAQGGYSMYARSGKGGA
jgi:hypothetical protein